MIFRANTLFVALLGGALIGVVACGDDDETTTTTTTTTTTSTTTGGGMGGSGGGALTCEEACSALYDCGAENDNCPGFAALPKMDFVDGCIPGCEANPALIAVINPADCAGTVATVKAVNADFATVCDGAGGGGGAGGAGGAP